MAPAGLALPKAILMIVDTFVKEYGKTPLKLQVGV
jgi:hypothetical protein